MADSLGTNKQAESRRNGVPDVRFREIDRVFDLMPGHFLVDLPSLPGGISEGSNRYPRKGGPTVVEQFGVAKDGQVPCRDEDGNQFSLRQEQIPPVVKGWYRSISVSRMTTVLRTFVRPDSNPVKKGQYVYILSDQGSRQFTLTYGLSFVEDGKFKLLRLGEPDADLSDAPLYDRWHFDEMLLGKPVRNCAFLSPFPLPPVVEKALTTPQGKDDEALLGNALARAAFFDDPFVCDVMTGTAPKPPVSQSGQKPEVLETGERIVYLVNPFKEAMFRAMAYKEAVGRLLEAQAQAGQNAHYVLAKRIEAVVGKAKKKADLVPSLYKFIDEVERPIEAIWLLTEERAAALLRWVAYPYQPFFGSWFGARQGMGQVTFNVKPSKGGLGAADPQLWNYQIPIEQKDACSAFSSAVFEAHHGAEDLSAMVAKLTEICQSDLDLTEQGRQFLKLQVARCKGEEPILPGRDDGLLAGLLHGRKVLKPTVKIWGGVVQNLWPYWQLQSGRLAFDGFADFIRHKTGEDINSPQLQADRKRLQSIKRQNRAEYDAARSNAKRLIPKGKRPTQVYGQESLSALKLGYFVVSMAGLYEQWEKVRKDPSTRNVAASVSALLSTTDSALSAMRSSWSGKGFLEQTLKLARKYEYREIAGFRVPPAYAKLRLLGSLAGVLDTSLNLYDAAMAKNGWQGAGYAIRAFGSALGIVGAVSAETGVGVIAALVGMGVQWIGDVVIEMGNEMNSYLRTCPWGVEAAGTDSIASLNLRLDYLLYGFQWDVEVRPETDTGKNVVLLSLDMNKAWPVFDPAMEMAVDLSVEHSQGLWQPVRVSMRLSFEELYGPEICAVRLATFPRSAGPTAPWMRVRDNVVVKGALSMLVNQRDGRRVEATVQRECSLPSASPLARDPGIV